MKFKFRFLVFSIFALGLLFMASVSFSNAGISDLKGRILLQVEDHGKAWYVDPIGGQRAYLGSQDNALKVVRGFGLGITNKDLARIALKSEVNPDLTLAKRLAGRILLQVEARGEAWYVNPVDYKKYYLGKPSDMYDVMRTLSLGITNADLSKIIVNENYKDDSGSQSIVSCTADTWQCGDWSACASNNFNTRTCVMTNDCAGVDTPAPVASQACIYIAPVVACNSYDYTAWTRCDDSGNQTRSYLKSYPDNCTGTPLLTQKCDANFNVNIYLGNTPSFKTGPNNSISTDIIYTFNNKSNYSTISFNGLIVETILDTDSGLSYGDQAYINIFDEAGNLIGAKNINHDYSNEVVFNSTSTMILAPQQILKLTAKIGGFGGTVSSPHITARLANLMSTTLPTGANLIGLPVGASIYRGW
jgi:hypothetical protein